MRLFYCLIRGITFKLHLVQNIKLLCLSTISTTSGQLTSPRKYSGKEMVRTAQPKLECVFYIELGANSLKVNFFSSLFLWTEKYIPSFCNRGKYLSTIFFGGGGGGVTFAILSLLGRRTWSQHLQQSANSDSATLTWSIDSQCRPTQLPRSGVRYCSRLYYTTPNHPSTTNTHPNNRGVHRHN
jgi:hypothetical protein